MLMRREPTHLQLGNKNDALKCFSNVFREKRGTISRLNTVVLYHLERGEVSTVLEVFQEAVASFTSSHQDRRSSKEGKEHGLMMTLTHIGRLRRSYREYELAVLGYAEARRITTALKICDNFAVDLVVLEHISCVRYFLATDLRAARM